MRRMRPQHCWQAMMFVATLTAFTALPSTVGAQSRGSSGLPTAPGNPLAALQNQAVQGAAEQNLVVLRGTVAGMTGQVLAGQGFTVTTNPIAGSPFPTYTVVFDTPFSSPPSVVVSVHGFFPTQFVQTIAVDDGAGGISKEGVHRLHRATVQHARQQRELRFPELGLHRDRSPLVRPRVTGAHPRRP